MKKFKVLLLLAVMFVPMLVFAADYKDMNAKVLESISKQISLTKVNTSAKDDYYHLKILIGNVNSDATFKEMYEDVAGAKGAGGLVESTVSIYSCTNESNCTSSDGIHLRIRQPDSDGNVYLETESVIKDRYDAVMTSPYVRVVAATNGKGIAGWYTDEKVISTSSLDIKDETVTTHRRVSDTESELYTGCPLGEDVTKDLYGALKIFKIAAPLLVIGFTVFEFVQALAKGDITAELKKLSQRLLKRCIFAVVLFFLPVLVNQVMQLANVWDENGTCDFSNSVEVKPDDSRTEEERRVTSCAGHSDLTSCNNDTTNKCKWSYSGNFCEAEEIKSDDENRVTSCGGHSDLTSCNKDTTNNCKWNYTGNYCERVKCGDFGDNSTCTKNGCSWSYSGNFCEYKKQ